MCGIAGLLVPGADEARLSVRCARMVDAIAHRGPDGHGLATHPGLAFGHARLAIVDLSDAAAQPMRSGSGRSLIAFNGEIYNHKELRRDLQALGQRFRTNSDTEVLLASYETWGESFVERLNGIFVFALYDLVRGRVMLARDRLGVKPLYWRRAAGSIVFGSEIKAVAAADPQSLSVDREGLLEFLSFQNYLGRRTLFEGVELFPPGHLALIGLDDLSVRESRFWAVCVQALEEPEPQTRERLDAALRAAVTRQMEADVPVNSFLSGGIDSCAIAALATRSAGRIKTFTCGFGVQGVTEGERQFDERHTAEMVAANLGSEHYETVLNADDFLARMHDWAWHAEEPRVGSSFPNFCISGLASRFTKVCMSGTGGDEMFAGYPWRYQAAWDEPDWDAFLLRYHGFWHRMMSAQDFRALAAPLQPQRFDSLALFREHLDSARTRVAGSANPTADAALIFEAETFLQGLLIVEDKASMAHGLEVRVPLLDNELVDLALAIPIGYKLVIAESSIQGGYGSKGVSVMPAFTSGKKILREVLAGYVPAEVAGGRKQGFSPPFESWFRKGLRGWLDGEVFAPRSRLADYLDMRTARSIWTEHAEGRQNHRLFVWGMVSLYLALTTFMERTR
jgi:asparagine synthase (glutamine-hydrolysing)